jgi:hypothetical protein
VQGSARTAYALEGSSRSLNPNDLGRGAGKNSLKCAKVVPPKVGMHLHPRLMGWGVFWSCDLSQSNVSGVSGTS